MHVLCETYKMQFEAAGEVNNWNDQEKSTALVIVLQQRLTCFKRYLLPTRKITSYATFELHFEEQQHTSCFAHC